MAQAAVERARRQEDGSATGSFLLLLFRFSLEKPARAAARTAGEILGWKQKRKKGRSTREGSAVLLSPDDIENHSDSGGRTSSEREVMLRYGQGREITILDLFIAATGLGPGGWARLGLRFYAAIGSASAIAEAASCASTSRSCFLLALSSSPNWNAPPMRDR